MQFITWRQISPESQLIFVVLKVVSALLRCPSWQLASYHVPVAAVSLQKFHKLVFLIPLPLVLCFDAAAEKGRLVHWACDLSRV
jgi:hypothetical protein